MTELDNAKLDFIQASGSVILGECAIPRKRGLCFIEVTDSTWRKLFDEALDITHYAGSCQRVGRWMRLARLEDGNWVGGIVLGSTFANVLGRAEALG